MFYIIYISNAYTTTNNNNKIFLIHGVEIGDVDKYLINDHSFDYSYQHFIRWANHIEFVQYNLSYDFDLQVFVGFTQYNYVVGNPIWRRTDHM